MAQEPDAEYEMTLHNVTCWANVGCRVNLQKLAENCHNVELRNNKVTIRLRKPNVTAHVWSKGTISCVGAHSEAEARTGIRRIARMVQKEGFDVKLGRICLVNAVASCTLPFRVKLRSFAVCYQEASYEPELLHAATYKIPDLRAHLRIYATGSVTIIAPTVANIYKAARYVYPRVEKFRLELTAADHQARTRKRILVQKRLLFQK